MEQEERLRDFFLSSGRSLNFLRTGKGVAKSKLTHVRESPEENFRKFKQLERNLISLDFSQNQIDTIYRVLAAILLLGEINFKHVDQSSINSDVESPQLVTNIATLLKIDGKKFQWVLLNHCVVVRGHAERKRHNPDEAREVRDVLANTIYSRLVDYIVNIVNSKLELSRAI